MAFIDAPIFAHQGVQSSPDLALALPLINAAQTLNYSLIKLHAAKSPDRPRCQKACICQISCLVICSTFDHDPNFDY